jgi:hypothetical protein
VQDGKVQMLEELQYKNAEIIDSYIFLTTQNK